MKTLKELVQGRVNFEYYRSGHLYYSTSVDSDFIFPVPVEDTGEASFLKEDKAMLFMRYIRKFMKELEEDKK
jgi:hypothetical protein